MAFLTNPAILLLLMTAFTSGVTRAEDDTSCRPLWTRFRDNCYRFFGDVKTWEDAENHCRQFVAVSKPGHLVSIHSKDENDFIYTLWKTSQILGLDPEDFDGSANRANSIWIGLNDRATEGTYVWSDQSLVNFGPYWKPGQPDNYNQQEECCSMLDYNDTQDDWNDLICGRPNPYICKIPTE